METRPPAAQIWLGIQGGTTEGAEIDWAGAGTNPSWATDIYGHGFRIFNSSADYTLVSIAGGTGTAGLYVQGRSGINDNFDPQSMFDVFDDSASRIGTIIRGATSQTADLQEWQKSDGTVLTFVRNDGTIFVNDGGLNATSDCDGCSVVQGHATLTTATTSTNGGYFSTAAPLGSGVVGLGAATTGHNAGGYFYTNSSDGNGVVGAVTSSGTGSNNGGYFYTNSPTGVGVYGAVNATTSGANYGGYFFSASPTGIGVLAASGNAASRSLVVKGAGGQTGHLTEWQKSDGTVLTSVGSAGQIVINQSYLSVVQPATSGAAVTGHETTTGSTDKAYGGYFVTDNINGDGVVGIGSATTGTAAGGYFYTNSPTASGVVGIAASTDTGVNYGGFSTAAARRVSAFSPPQEMPPTRLWL